MLIPWTGPHQLPQTSSPPSGLAVVASPVFHVEHDARLSDRYYSDSSQGSSLGRAFHVEHEVCEGEKWCWVVLAASHAVLRAA